MRKLIAALASAVLIFISLGATATPAIDRLAGLGPSDGEFKAWTKLMDNGTQLKFYAKFLQPGQKVQFMVQNEEGVYEQLAWKRITEADLGSEGEYQDLQNHVYFIRTLNLKEGKNRVRILVDGELYWGTKTYVGKATGGDQDSSAADFELSREIVEDEICKLQEVSEYRRLYQGNLASSFPPVTNSPIPQIGAANMTIVFVEWEDLRGTEADKDYYRRELAKSAEFLNVMSEGKFELTMDYEPDWILVDGSYEDYYVPDSMAGGSWQSFDFLQVLIDGYVEATDPFVDYSNTDILFLAFPREKMVVEGGGVHIFDDGDKGPTARTNEGNITTIYTMGTWAFERESSGLGWGVFVHEFGHTLKLPDLRDWSGDLQERSRAEYLMYLINPMYGFDIMDNQGSGTRNLSGWLKWVLGWLDDDQVTCVESQSVERQYYRINEANRVGLKDKLLLIKVSETKALAVESRRLDSRFDLPVINSRDGVIVYSVDATLGHQEGPLKLISPRDLTNYLSEPNVSPDWRVLDTMLFVGDKVESDGISISVEFSGEGYDIVKVSR